MVDVGRAAGVAVVVAAAAAVNNNTVAAGFAVAVGIGGSVVRVADTGVAAGAAAEHIVLHALVAGVRSVAAAVVVDTVAVVSVVAAAAAAVNEAEVLACSCIVCRATTERSLRQLDKPLPSPTISLAYFIPSFLSFVRCCHAQWASACRA